MTTIERKAELYDHMKEVAAAAGFDSITEAVTVASRAKAEEGKRAPVQGYSPGIPWAMHLEAYDAYCKRWSPQPALIQGGCRGGFGVGELDMFIPGWRQKLDIVTKLKARVAELEGDLSVARLQRDAKRWTDGLPRVRHVRRGSVYEVLGEAEAQISTSVDIEGFGRVGKARLAKEGDRLTVYRGEDGKLWVRFSDEFSDGRFEVLP